VVLEMPDKLAGRDVERHGLNRYRGVARTSLGDHRADYGVAGAPDVSGLGLPGRRSRSCHSPPAAGFPGVGLVPPRLSLPWSPGFGNGVPAPKLVWPVLDVERRDPAARGPPSGPRHSPTDDPGLRRRAVPRKKNFSLPRRTRFGTARPFFVPDDLAAVAVDRGMDPAVRPDWRSRGHPQRDAARAGGNVFLRDGRPGIADPDELALVGIAAHRSVRSCPSRRSCT